MRLSVEEVCSVLGLEVSAAWAGEIVGVSFDSRTLHEGALFACIRGERTDGHQYGRQAEERGARAILAERPLPGLSVPVLVVPDTCRALERLAAHARRTTRAKVVGLTGTCGKTTVKELIASMCSQAGKTAKSPANHNNQLGMSVGMLNADGDEDFWVFEAGISHPGDMDALGAMLQPDCALIVNIGAGHTEFLEDLGVAWHKSRLLLHLAAGGTAVVSADYPELVWKALGTHVPDLRFFSARPCASEDATANYATFLGEDADGFGRFRLVLGGEAQTVRAPLLGPSGAEDVAAAALVCQVLGIDRDCIARGLGAVELPPQRFHRLRFGAIDLIDDSYNANPLSMTRMLDAARLEPKPLVCVLGEMRELGRESGALHRALGQHLAGLSPQPVAVFWKGGGGSEVQEGLDEAGYRGEFVPCTEAGPCAEAVLERLASYSEGAVILVKGSRANALEEVVARLSTAISQRGEQGADHGL